MCRTSFKAYPAPRTNALRFLPLRETERSSSTKTRKTNFVVYCICEKSEHSREFREFPHFGLEHRGDIRVIPSTDPFPGVFRVGVDAAVAAAAILAVVIAVGVSTGVFYEIVAVALAVAVPVVDAGGLIAIICGFRHVEADVANGYALAE